MLALALPLLAPRAAVGAEPSKDGDVVVTGTRSPEQAQRATVKTDVVTRDEAERRGATSVAEALATQPGVRVDPGAFSQLGGVSGVRIQGFDLQRVLVLEDGEPMVGDIGGAIDLSSLPVADLRRVEIVTGPTSSLYGSGAIGGVINVVTGPPRYRGASLRARAERRSRDGVYGAASASYAGRDAWSTVDASFTRHDGVSREPSLPDLQVPAASRSMVSVRAGGDVTARWALRARVRWLRDASDGVSSVEAPGVGRYALDTPAATVRKTAHLIQSFELGRGATLRMTAGHQRADNTSERTQRGSEVGERHDRAHRLLSIEPTLTVARGSLSWIVGARGEREHFEQRITTVESQRAGLVRAEAEEVAPQTLARAAAYLQLQARVSPRTTWLAGARGETHTTYGSKLTPRAAVSYRPRDTVSLRAGAGQGFRAPSAKERGFLFDHSSLGYRVVGNRALSPETSWGVNGDASWAATPEITLRAGAFANWVRDLIDLDLESGVASGGAVDYRYANFGRARSLGGSIGYTFRAGARLQADTSYDYLYTRDDVRRRPLGGRPPHTLTSSLRVRPTHKLELSVRHRVSSDAWVSDGVRAPGYATLDLRAAWDATPSAQVYAGGTNVTDVHPDPGRVGDLRPPLGRTLFAGVKIELHEGEP